MPSAQVAGELRRLRRGGHGPEAPCFLYILGAVIAIVVELTGTLVASGLIAGGALAGVLQGMTDILQEWSDWTMPQFGATGWGGNWIGLIVFLALGTGIYLDAHRARPDPGTS